MGAALNTWCDLLRRYLEANEEGPFLYRERSQVGFLAAAIWVSGGIALEEWHLEKTKVRAEGGSGDSYKGRGDLWFTVDSDSAEHPGGWYLEAKHDFDFAGTVVARLEDRNRSGLAQAIADASHLIAGSNRIACKFVSILIPRSTKELDSVSPRLIADLRASRPDADAFAWFVAKPSQIRPLIAAQPHGDSCAIATVLLLARCQADLPSEPLMPNRSDDQK